MKNWLKIKGYNRILLIVKGGNKFDIPKEVLEVAIKLKKANFEAFLVGGCVRDLILGRKPKDWDFTTKALPEDIINIFNDTFYENKYGTVGVVNGSASDETLKVIEVTPYRKESVYSDFRRPDEVQFGATLEEDLSRRDFTVNAMALDVFEGVIRDPYKGKEDLKNKVLRTVGDPDERFKEDGLRMLRAIRISTELGFTVNFNTEQSIKSNANLIKKISKERIREEFTRILMSEDPAKGLILCQKTGLLKNFIPELEDTIGIEQNKAHSFDVWTHLLKSLQHSAKKNMPFHVRLAALFHDISKPESRKWLDSKKDWTFYGHDVVGARRTKKILEDLRFSHETIEKVVNLVRWHMFFSDTEKITLSAVRRMISRVGKEEIWNLMDLRICDRIGTGRPKESPYRLRKYRSMIEEVISDPVSVSMLNIDGNEIMKITNINPGPEVGYILQALLDKVLENPDLNKKDYLSVEATKLSKLSKEELKKIGSEAKNNRELEQENTISQIRKKYWVQ